ncbi:histidine kinase/DNA gyrase B/HSP90-like ATPase [Lutibacter sp. Hel_I_33_5]|uniref:sensor histidine kinase n=1 Tax=Lutibacter sp. Hel_I_33_5 TaxID=1566289 RepID=UPI0011A2E78B|nr:sensor histidine kinase [Lutibacter sp. Hel_I_33_5]TVZ56585.1 histidine kinase/DNA gyrase B/HSP90-like ATPase [Lutibacter sp. Hel_I_33_5]
MEELLAEENQVIAIVLIGVLLLLLMGVALLLFFFFSRKKIVEKELEKKSLEINHQKKMIQSIIVTQEKERKRIAQDLHDDISSKLNVINLNANLLKDGDLDTKEYKTVNNNILEATDKTLESARKIAHNLLPPILEKFGFKDAVEELADSFNNSKKITINYTINYHKNYLTKENELHLFRIVQELINNSVRHGKAKISTLDINFEDQKLLFKYTDNGKGFNMNDQKFSKGLGMKNIETRISLLNGEKEIKSEDGKGFKINIKI